MQSDMAEFRKTDMTTALKFIFEKNWPTIGDEFFRSLVRHLAGALGVRYTYITECTDPTRTRVRTLAFWVGEDFGENIEYDLAGTPCENVMKGNISYYPKDVQALFPRDEYFVTLGVQSYLGIPFFDTSNNLIGHLGLLDTKPMDANVQEIPILKVFATRAGLELERMQAQAELRKYRNHLEEMVDQRTRMLKTTNKQLQQEITERKQAEEELQSVNEQLNRVITNMPVGVAILEGLEFKYSKINRTLADINGPSVEDHIGRSLAEVIPEAAKDIIPRLRRVWKSNTTSPQYEFSTRLPKDPDHIKYFMDSFFPIEGKDGKVKAIGVVVLDITNRRESERALKESHDLLEHRVKERTKELRKSEKDLIQQKQILEEKNIALNEIIMQIEIEKNKVKENIMSNVDQLIIPNIKKLRRRGTPLDCKLIDLLEKNLGQLTSAFGGKVSKKHLKLTPREIEICNLIRNGLISKEIASLLHIHYRSVELHRNHIRRKLNISNKDINLTSYLQSF